MEVNKVRHTAMFGQKHHAGLFICLFVGVLIGPLAHALLLLLLLLLPPLVPVGWEGLFESSFDPFDVGFGSKTEPKMRRMFQTKSLSQSCPCCGATEYLIKN